MDQMQKQIYGVYWPEKWLRVSSHGSLFFHLVLHKFSYFWRRFTVWFVWFAGWHSVQTHTNSHLQGCGSPSHRRHCCLNAGPASLTLGQVSDARPALRQRYCLLLDALLALLLPWQKTLSDSAWHTFIISAIIPSPDLLPLRHNTARLRGANKIMPTILYLKCLLSSFRGYKDVNIAQI